MYMELEVQCTCMYDKKFFFKNIGFFLADCNTLA